MISSIIRNQMLVKLNNVTNDEHKSKLIETSVYKFLEDFVKNYSKIKGIICKKLYIAKMQQVYHLLLKDSYLNFDSNHLLDDLEKLETIAFLDYKSLCPAKWNLLQPDLDILDKKITNTSDNVYTTDLYKCSHCKLNSCVYSEVQVKKCDENATIFVRCLNCHHSFRG